MAQTESNLNLQTGSAWQNPGSAAFDFRSDVVTRPTASMLEAIANTSLLDDDFMEDPTTNSLQEFVAKLANQEDGLLVMSGTMGNQVAIRTHLTQPPYTVLCDHRAHIIHYEAGGVATWSSAYVKGIEPSNGRYLVLEDIQKHAILNDDFHGCPTRVISLENTLDGMILPLSEAKRICEWAHSHGLKVHLDGARLWEAVTAGAGSLPDYTALFDSVSLCFSKGLGAPIGSILVGSTEFIKKARWFRKSIGGGTRQSGIITAAARVAVEETFGKGPRGEGGKLRASHENARRIADVWVQKGGKLACPTETNMVWFNLDAAGISTSDWEKLGQREGLKLMGNRLVVHYHTKFDTVVKQTVSQLHNHLQNENNSGKAWRLTPRRIAEKAKFAQTSLVFAWDEMRWKRLLRVRRVTFPEPLSTPNHRYPALLLASRASKTRPLTCESISESQKTTAAAPRHSCVVVSSGTDQRAGGEVEVNGSGKAALSLVSAPIRHFKLLSPCKR
ncbi:beta-eliminating lyase [Emydomyces testavorans]|uniref:Beta-eliminating lyase n=1 Tax=Emydomyces testavorans TaxID=2070801 RepID=A0AAF0DH84_9EURO|nr:beta-eliminating lyase [Emydomyces testavorans]